MTQPKHIRTDHRFMNSVFQNSECETILRNIILLQKSQNPDHWTPFTWDEYKAFCTHSVTDSELQVLNAFVMGGKPTYNTSAILDPGWLHYDTQTKQFTFSQKMIEMLGEKYQQPTTTAH